MQALNISLFQWLAAGSAPHPQLLWMASVIAERSPWACVAIMAWAVWRKPAQRSYCMGTLAAAAVAAIAAHMLANAINAPRPFMLGLSPAHILHGARGSMPSAHASVMFTVALVLCMRPPLRTAGLAMFVIAAMTGWARVYVGVHFPFDILGGLLLAVVVTALFWVVLRLTKRFFPPQFGGDSGPSLQSTGADQLDAVPLDPQSVVRHA